MTSFKKLEFKVKIQAPPHLFYDVLTNKPQCFSTITSGNVQNCSVESDKEETVLSFDYIHDGKKKTVKDIIEKKDDKNFSTTWKVIDGDLLREYKSFKVGMQVTSSEAGSLVHWTFEYENNEGSPDPQSLLEYFVNNCKIIDAHLINAQPNNA